MSGLSLARHSPSGCRDDPADHDRSNEELGWPAASRRGPDRELCEPPPRQQPTGDEASNRDIVDGAQDCLPFRMVVLVS